MTVTFFGTHMGFFCISQEVLTNAFPNLSLMAQASVGGEQQAAEAKNKLLREFPRLDQIPRHQRAEKLTNRVFYDAALSVPWGMAIGFLFSACVCIPPCTAGTTFASQLLHRPENRFVSFLRYIEFALVVQVLCRQS